MADQAHPADLDTLMAAFHSLARGQADVSREEGRRKDLGVYSLDAQELASRRLDLDLDDEPLPMPEPEPDELKWSVPLVLSGRTDAP